MFFFIKKQHNTYQRTGRGFSLIELMVSLTIFSILMVVSVGTLLTLIDANAKAQALSSATTNLSFAIDSITRAIRTGHSYHCENNVNTNLPGDDGTLNPRDCDGEKSITFIRDRDGYRIGYRLNNNKIEQQIVDLNDNTNGWEAITSSDIEITTFNIITSGSETYIKNGADTDQPVVTLQIKGRVANKNGLETETDFNIQTLIVQRRLDQV